MFIIFTKIKDIFILNLSKSIDHCIAECYHLIQLMINKRMKDSQDSMDFALINYGMELVDLEVISS